jgi:predicted amidohydrolase
MRIGYIQYSPETGDKEKNLETIKRLIKNVSADLFVLPEMGLTAYPDSTIEKLINHAEKLDGFLVSEITKIAKESNACIVVGMPEIIEDKIYNTTVAVGPEGLLASHQKSHLFMEEKDKFTPGTNKPILFEWRGYKIGIGVCYDYMFPEFWKKLALDGAQLFCNTANFVSNYGFPVMRTRSIENGVFSITTNRTGQDLSQKYTGGSEIVDNRGNILAKASEESEEVQVVDVDLSLSDDKTWNGINNLVNDRREDLYK